MGCSCCHTGHNQKNEDKSLSLNGYIKKYWRPLMSILMLISGLLIGQFEILFFKNNYFLFTWYLIAYLPVGVPVLKEGWEHICKKDLFNEFSLMSIAAIGAFYIGDYPEAVSVMLFYSIGEIFQERAVSNARKHISSLLDVRPKSATVIRMDEVLVMEPHEVRPGEIIEIRAGERVPLDGIMLGDMSTFNTSALTGESIPRAINCGEDVLSGMIPSDKTIRVEVTKPYNESTLARILDLIQNATERKAPTEMLITKFAHIYTPIVFAIAVLVIAIPFVWSLGATEFIFEFNDWLYRALVFLVISCPCALVISIPLGYFGGIGAASRQGILFKGGNYLDAITKVNTIVFDKTGTLTKGVFDIQTIGIIPSFSEIELVSIIASVERNSTHPIAKTITKYAQNNNICVEQVEDISEVAGYGMKARLNGKEILVGNTRLLSMYSISYPVELDSIVDTLVVCAMDGNYIGNITLSDTLKDDAIESINKLKALNINNIQVLSGDKQHIVTNFAKKLGIVNAFGDLLPQGKVDHINRLKQNADNKIAFVGDGMNDAPVLALSDVGIAMGSLGSDLAIETADIIIQNDQPTKIATAIMIGRYTHKIVWQNIALAMGIKLLIMILGAFGVATLWEAVFADVGVALLAVLNALRIGYIVKNKEL